MMKVVGIDHVTAVVGDAELTAGLMSKILGIAPSAVATLPDLEIRSFKIGDVEMHLVAPTGPGGVRDHCRLHGTSFHHLAVRVSNLDEAIADLSTRGFGFLGSPIRTAPGLREVFLDPRTTGALLIQIVERLGEEQSEGGTLDTSAIGRLVERART